MPRIDRNARARLLFQAEALDRRTRRPGQHGGVLKRTGLAVLKALLLQFANVVTGRCDPGYATLARVAGVARSTVAVALARLEAAGLLERVRRQVGTVRHTNAYVFPKSEFRPETTINKKIKSYNELSTGRRAIPGPGRPPDSDPGMAATLARIRAELADTHAVLARLRTVCHATGS